MSKRIPYPEPLQQIIWLLVLASITILAACGPDFDNPLDPKNAPDNSGLIEAGWLDYESGNIDEAVTKFRQVTTKDPQQAEARIGLGWGLFRQQDAQGAINEFQTALVIDPDAVDAHVGIAGAFLTTEKYQSAIDHAQAALRLKPNYTFAHDALITSENLHLVLAEGYYYLGDYTKATEEVTIVDASVEVDQGNIASDLLRVLEELTQRINGR